MPNNIGDKILLKLRDSLEKTEKVRIRYHYEVEINTVDVDPCYYEVEHVGGNMYKLRKEETYSDIDGFYSFDTFEPISSVNGLYEYIKSHHIKPGR